MSTVISVPVYEYERDWGSRLDDHMLCIDSSDADLFVKEFNSKNDKDSVPDWYMIASDDKISIEVTDDQYEEILNTENKRIWKSCLNKKV